jgi:hypothetical protein
MASTSSNLFLPYKALGLVVGERIPLAYRANEQKQFPILFAALGNVVQQVRYVFAFFFLLFRSTMREHCVSFLCPIRCRPR